MLFRFFFFKQKTAYEMCGRDWSSDVCSSDLLSSIAKLKRLLADAMLDNAGLKDLLSRKW